MTGGVEKSFGLDDKGNAMWHGSNWSAGVGDNVIIIEGHGEISNTKVYKLFNYKTLGEDVTNASIDKVKRDIEERKMNPGKFKGGKW